MTNVPVTRASFPGSVGDPWSALQSVLGKGLVLRFGHPLIFEAEIPYCPLEQPQFELRRNSLK